MATILAHRSLPPRPVAACCGHLFTGTWDYTPFGEARQQPVANEEGDSFTGHITDTDTGMVYMQARYYDPAIGRFLSGDPVGFASGGVGYLTSWAHT
ncbi:RHS repeat-associated core domain-containing protein [Maricaulis sp.]